MCIVTITKTILNQLNITEITHTITVITPVLISRQNPTTIINHTITIASDQLTKI